MNERIKWHELPNGYIVTDKYHQSGNKDFIDEFTKQDATDNKTGLPTKVNFLNIPNHIFGSKHIQLVAANIKDYSETDGYNDRPLTNGDMYFNSGGFSNWNAIMPKKEYEKIQLLIKSGKDFFIYRASEVK